MSNFDFDKYFDEFLAAHASEGTSLDNIMSAFTNAANRQLIIQKEKEEEAKRQAEEKARAEKGRVRKAFEYVLDVFTEFLYDQNILSAAQYDEFWDSFDDETCDSLLEQVKLIGQIAFATKDSVKALEDYFSNLFASEDKKDDDAAAAATPVQEEKKKVEAEAPKKTKPVIKIRTSNPKFSSLVNAFLNDPFWNNPLGK